MLYTFNDCKNKYGNSYQVGKAVDRGDIYKIEKGIYSDKEYVSEIEIISKKYPKAIFTLNSAFYYYGLTDSIPQKYHLKTAKNTKQIRDQRVVQIYENSNVLEMGLTKKEQDGVTIRIYNKERLLLELLRNKNKLPFDYYKEIVTNYRKISHELDFQKIQDYLKNMPKAKMIMEALQMEVL